MLFYQAKVCVTKESNTATRLAYFFFEKSICRLGHVHTLLQAKKEWTRAFPTGKCVFDVGITVTFTIKADTTILVLFVGSTISLMSYRLAMYSRNTRILFRSKPTYPPCQRIATLIILNDQECSQLAHQLDSSSRSLQDASLSTHLPTRRPFH